MRKTTMTVRDVMVVTLAAAYRAVAEDKDNLCETCGDIHGVYLLDLAKSVGVDLDAEIPATVRPPRGTIVYLPVVPDVSIDGATHLAVWIDRDGAARGWWCGGPGKPDSRGTTAESIAAADRGWAVDISIPGEDVFGLGEAIAYLRDEYNGVGRS